MASAVRFHPDFAALGGLNNLARGGAPAIGQNTSALRHPGWEQAAAGKTVPGPVPPRSRAGAAVAETQVWCECKPRKEKFMEATKRVDTEPGDLRAKLEAATEKAKVLYQKLQDKTVAAAKATDETVREHPYQAIGIAFGLGVLIGVLAARSRRSGD
jgi:ElaB/YqjD/DUF883 family membrane-anchored ribosome-binding protein